MLVPNEPKQRVGFLTEMFSDMKAKRSNNEIIWVDVDQFIFGFTGEYSSNPITSQQRFENVFDTSTLKAHRTATSALSGILWKKGGKSIRITRPENIPDTDENNKFYEMASEKFVAVIDNPNSRFSTAFESSLSDGLARGTTPLGVFRGADNPLVFRHFPTRFLFCRENDDSMIDTVAFRTWQPIYEVVARYGEDNVSKKVLDLYNSPSQSSTDLEVVHFIMPNTGKDRDQKPFLSIHLDIQNKHIMRDSFYEDMPIKVGRIYKDEWNVYGRSPATDAIMDVKRLNAVRGDVYETIEQQNKPPLGILSDAIAGQEIVDLSAGAVNMFNTEASVSGNPVFPLYQGGDPSGAFAISQDIRQAVSDHYNIDKLIDFNNETAMTATEFEGRELIRASSLGGLLNRTINEVLTPIVETSFGLLFNDGFFGFVEGSEQLTRESTEAAIKGQPFTADIIPKDIAEAFEEGEELFNIEYLTPASRMLDAEDFQAMNQLVGYAGSIGQLSPEALMNVDPDKMMRDAFVVRGQKDKLRTANEVQAIRDQQLQIQQAQIEQQQAQQGLDIAAQAKELQQ